MDEIMKTQPYKVLVRVDAAGRVVEINSSAFVQDTEGWMEIDSGWSDRYHHAQGNYLPSALADPRGLYRYKLVDGHIVPRTVEEIEGDYVPPVQVSTVEDRLKLIEAAIEKIKKLFGGAWND